MDKDFVEKLTSKGIKDKTISILGSNDIDSIDAIGALTNDELDSLGFSLGQKAILRKIRDEMNGSSPGSHGNRTQASESGAAHKSSKPERKERKRHPKSNSKSDSVVSSGAAAAPDSVGAVGGCSDPAADSSGDAGDSHVMWEWQSSKGWHRYSITVSDHIESAHSSGADSVDLSSVQPELTYTVDFKRMRQIHNIHKGKRRPIRRSNISPPDHSDQSDEED